MKNMNLLALFAFAISFQSIHASFEHHKDYKSNCQNLQDALTIAINARQDGIENVLTVTMVTSHFNQEQLVTCRKNYEQQHPGIFQKNPAFITGNKDGVIEIRVFSRQEADEAQKQAREIWLRSQKSN